MLETDPDANTLIRFVAGKVDEAATKYVDETRDGDKNTILSVYEEEAHEVPPKTRKPNPKKKWSRLKIRPPTPTIPTVQSRETKRTSAITRTYKCQTPTTVHANTSGSIRRGM